MSVMAELEAAVPALRRYAWSLLRNSADADDLVQDCLALALRRLASRTGTGDIRPWLFTIMHNLFVSRWRLKKRWERLLGRSGDASAEASVAPAQDWSLATRDLIAGLDLLAPEQRHVLLLVAVEGLEYRDAATALGVPVGTVMSRLSRARNALRAHMDGKTTDRPARPALRKVR